jgi:MFS family permease
MPADTTTASFDQELSTNHSRNAVLILVDAVFFGCGFAAFSPYTILPGFLKHFTDSGLAINAILALFMLGLFGVNLISTWLYDHQPRKRGALLGWSVVQRLSMLALAPLALVSLSLGNHVVPLFLLLYGMANFAWGMSAVLWTEMLGRWLRADRRTVVLGKRFFAEQIMNVVTGLVVLVLLAQIPFPGNYFAIFALGGIFWWISHGALMLTREAVYPVTNRRESPGSFAGSLLRILRTDRPFRRFVLAAVAVSSAAMTMALYTPYSLDTFFAHAAAHARDRHAGLANVLTGFSVAAGALSAGYLSRAWGTRFGLLLSSGCAGIAALTAFFAESLTVFYLAFVANGLAIGLSMVSMIAGLHVFGTVHQRLRYIGLANTIRGLALAGYAMGGGVLVELFGARTVFALSACLAAVAAGLILAMVGQTADGRRI